ALPGFRVLNSSEISKKYLSESKNKSNNTCAFDNNQLGCARNLLLEHSLHYSQLYSHTNHTLKLSH
ncbi:MAG: hypothetical protein QNJ17_01290, partial [Desulfocapsaceae bacterium]|nr:hypothetical protein [Desulfocapsaceae bacterium]